MKSVWMWIIIVLVIAGAAGAGYWFGHRTGGASAEGGEGEGGSEKKEPPVATVQVTPIRQGNLAERITAYGSIVEPASDVHVVSVAFESRVSRVLIATGQVVADGQPLIEVQGSPATQLMYREAQNALTATQRDLDLVQQRLQQHLATNTELYTAQTAFKTAQVRLQNLEQTGAGSPRQLKADAPGIVSKVDVQIGQVVPAGGPLLELAGQGQIMARLGVNSLDASLLKVGQPVALTRVNDPASKPLNGTIRLIGQRQDPTTHLVEVLVQPPPDSHLLLDEFVAGELTRSVAQGLIVPRDAVLPGDGNNFILFTVRDGKAVKHTVQVGVETDRQTQVIADDLKSGEPTVVSGNLELDDGMAVAAQQWSGPASAPATQPAETQPASGGGE